MTLVTFAATALVVLLIGCSGGDEDDPPVLAAASFLEALRLDGHPTSPTGQVVVCAGDVAGVEYEIRGSSLRGRTFVLFEYGSAANREAAWSADPDRASGRSVHGCRTNACIEWAFWNANLVLTTETTPECDTTPFDPAADPALAEVVHVLDSLD